MSLSVTVTNQGKVYSFKAIKDDFYFVFVIIFLTFDPVTGVCWLCLLEDYYIMLDKNFVVHQTCTIVY